MRIKFEATLNDVIRGKRKTRNAFSPCMLNNKRIRYEYVVIKRIEAGVSLLGWEVKAFRSHRVNISRSYLSFVEDEVFLKNAHFSAVDALHDGSFNPVRNRKILLHRREITSLSQICKAKGHTLVVLSLFFKNSFVKVSVGLARGRKKHDKRFLLKKREWDKKNSIKKNIDFYE